MIRELIEKPKPISEPKIPKRDWKYLIIFLLFMTSLLISAVLLFEEVVEKDEHGVYHLRQERKDKLQKDSLKLAEDCVQYALLATESAFYPCLNCANKDSVFLLEGEVYKYGYTCNGEKGRYGSAELIKQNLMFWVEFKGNVQECMYMELEKIIHYPLLPENLKRLPADRLARPAGNPYDK